MTKPLLLAAALLATLAACQGQESAPPPPPAPQPEVAPPTPPLHESFDGVPRLSLFPRLGDYRPENDDEVALPFWNTYIEHLVKTSGPTLRDPATGDRAWSFRGIRGIDSAGFFSPLAVEPSTSYRISFRLKADLPEGASAGLGILEYDRFLWIGEQYPQSLDEKHRTGDHPGLRLTGSHDWQEHGFTFTTGPETRMIHLVLFREGTPDRAPVKVDDIRVEKLDEIGG
ncbi:hypothetical protein [Geoalkalibacter sp.]|uniref:hypothetical protein n=1 Tax=Geoalkalibacter sp. TaxID=3041440 RepID=UPI00272DE570|nr:hypothetical protein [Geoalkalibacter sp.]